MHVYLQSGISYNKQELPLLLWTNLPVDPRGEGVQTFLGHLQMTLMYGFLILLSPSPNSKGKNETENQICTRFPKYYSHGSYKYWIIVRCNSALYVIIASIIVRDAITIHFVRTIFFWVSISFRLQFDGSWIGFKSCRCYACLIFGNVFTTTKSILLCCLFEQAKWVRPAILYKSLAFDFYYC